MSGCSPECKSLIKQFLYGRLSRKDTEKFHDHLFDCAECRQVFLEECMLKEFTRDNSARLMSQPIDENVWSKLKTLLKETSAGFLTPAFPILFRNSTHTALTRNVLYTMNFTGKPDICPVNPLYSLNGERLIINGLRTDNAEYDIFLLVCSKSDLSSIRSMAFEGIQSLVTYWALKLSMTKKMDENVQKIINQSLVIEGSFEEKSDENGQCFNAVFMLSEIAVSYVLNPNYIPIVMLK